ncbi:peptidyl-prolyl cis-trans isomerase B (cyclophilin B), partial [Nematocida parisii]
PMSNNSNLVRIPSNPVVYLDISSNNKFIGKLRIQLASNIVPRTVNNFLKLATGNVKDKSGYKNSIFHRVIKGFMIQGGDIINGNGTGSISIYGSKFKDENFNIPHKKYCISMANSGRDTNGSQFFITTGDTDWLNGKHVVFGEVISGTEVLAEIENIRCDRNDRPINEVKVVDCGVE